MHIAIGITLRHRTTGDHYKINVASGGLVKLRDEVNTHDTAVPVEQMAEVFEEFGPVYAGLSEGLLTAIHLERCPFCGSTHLDVASWMSDADVNNTGPGCMDCDAQGASVEAWNKRHVENDLEQVLQAAGRVHGVRHTMPNAKLIPRVDHVIANLQDFRRALGGDDSPNSVILEASYFATLAEAVLNPNSDTAAWLIAAGKPDTVDDLRALLADAASRSVVIQRPTDADIAGENQASTNEQSDER